MSEERCAMCGELGSALCHNPPGPTVTMPAGYWYHAFVAPVEAEP